MFDFSFIARPHPVMPVGNPIQFVIDTDRTTRPLVDSYGCVISELQYSFYDNNTLTLDIGGGAPLAGSWIEISGDRYTFLPCADKLFLSSPYYIDTTEFDLSGDFCDLAAAIVDAINKNPDNRARYFAIELGAALDLEPPGVILTPASSCSATSLTIRIVAARIDLDLNVSQSPGDWAAYGGSPWAGPTRTPARNYFVDYRIYNFVWVEYGDYGFGNYAESKRQSNLPVPFSDNLPDPPRLWIDPERRFIIDVSALLRNALAYDIPDPLETKIRYCFRCIKRYYFAFGESRKGVGDGTLLDYGVQVNKFQYDLNEDDEPQLYTVLNAWLPIYDSGFATRSVDNGTNCETISSAPYLLSDFFEDAPRNFLFVVSDSQTICGSTYNKQTRHAKGAPLWLHWWLSDETRATLKLFARYYYSQTETIIETALDFTQEGNCETPASYQNQLLQIPAHAVLDLDDVHNFDLWLQNGETVVSNVLSFSVESTCEGLISLAFVNRYGVFQMIHLRGSIVASSQREYETYERQRLVYSEQRHAPQNRERTTHVLTAGRRWECEIVIFRNDDMNQLIDLAISPDVMLLVNNQLIPVTIDEGDFPIMQTVGADVGDFQLTLIESKERYG